MKVLRLHFRRKKHDVSKEKRDPKGRWVKDDGTGLVREHQNKDSYTDLEFAPVSVIRDRIAKHSISIAEYSDRGGKGWLTSTSKVIPVSSMGHDSAARRILAAKPIENEEGEFIWTYAALDAGWVRICINSGVISAQTKDEKLTPRQLSDLKDLATLNGELELYHEYKNTLGDIVCRRIKRTSSIYAMVKKFNELEPRDNRGRWTAGSATAVKNTLDPSRFRVGDSYIVVGANGFSAAHNAKLDGVSFDKDNLVSRAEFTGEGGEKLVLDFHKGSYGTFMLRAGERLEKYNKSTGEIDRFTVKGATDPGRNGYVTCVRKGADNKIIHYILDTYELQDCAPEGALEPSLRKMDKVGIKGMRPGEFVFNARGETMLQLNTGILKSIKQKLGMWSALDGWEVMREHTAWMKGIEGFRPPIRRSLDTDDMIERLSKTSGVPTGFIDAMISDWCESSTGGSSIGYQEAARKLFNAPSNKYVDAAISDNFHEHPEVLTSIVDAASDALPAMYSLTQKRLEEFPGDSITLYRALRPEGVVPSSKLIGKTITYQDNPLASWSWAARIPSDFMKEGKITVKARIPKKDILCTPATGFGNWGECEVVVINRKPTVAEVLDVGGTSRIDKVNSIYKSVTPVDEPIPMDIDMEWSSDWIKDAAKANKGRKSNPNHDPKNGRFVSGSGGSSNEPSQAMTFLNHIGDMIDGSYHGKETYLNRHRLVAEHGREFGPGDVHREKPQMEAKMCYNNSITRMFHDQSDYMEGYVFVHGIPLEHAWNAKDGKQEDHTITDPERWTYVGVRIPMNVVMPVCTSKHFGRSDGGILGAINYFPQKKRDMFIARIVAANSPQTGGKSNPNHDERGRFSSSPKGKVDLFDDLPKGGLLETHRAALAELAQKQYDEWDASGEFGDSEVGFGGICHRIADDMADYLSEKGYDAVTQSASDEQHVYVVARDRRGVYYVDIRPYVYETGGGFSWKKIPDVTFDKNDVNISQLDGDPASMGDYLEDFEEWREGGKKFNESEPRDERGRWVKDGDSSGNTHHSEVSNKPKPTHNTNDDEKEKDNSGKPAAGKPDDGDDTDRFPVGYRKATTATERKAFHRLLMEAKAAHKFGNAVTDHGEAFYTDPANELYRTPNGLGGLVFTADGEIVSAFNHPANKGHFEELLHAVRPVCEGKTGDCYDINGYLPNLYQRSMGQVPVAMLRWDDSKAEAGWDYEKNGRPNVLLMLCDPHNKLGLDFSDYEDIKDRIPVFATWEEAASERDKVKAELLSIKGSKKFNEDEPRDRLGRWTETGEAKDEPIKRKPVGHLKDSKPPKGLARVVTPLADETTSQKWLNGLNGNLYRDLMENALGYSLKEATVKAIPYKSHGEFLPSREVRLMYESKTDLECNLSVQWWGKALTPVLHPDFIQLPDKKTGKDVGKKVMGVLLDIADHVGAKRISLNANVDVGGYAWARYGFLPDADTWGVLAANIRMRLAQRTFPTLSDKDAEKMKNKIRKLAAPGSSPKNLRMIAAIKIPARVENNFTRQQGIVREPKPLGKSLLLGTHWEGSIDLTNKSDLKLIHSYIRT